MRSQVGLSAFFIFLSDGYRDAAHFQHDSAFRFFRICAMVVSLFSKKAARRPESEAGGRAAAASEEPSH
jgi:hypothetical protein